MGAVQEERTLEERALGAALESGDELGAKLIVGKGSNTQKCWKTKEFVGAGGFF